MNTLPKVGQKVILQKDIVDSDNLLAKENDIVVVTDVRTEAVKFSVCVLPEKAGARRFGVTLDEIEPT